jgi:hypothetical protein
MKKQTEKDIQQLLEKQWTINCERVLIQLRFHVDPNIDLEICESIMQDLISKERYEDCAVLKKYIDTKSFKGEFDEKKKEDK